MPIPGPPLGFDPPQLIVEAAASSGNWPASPTWVDLTDRVRAELGDLKITRGTDDELNAREAGQLDGLMLDNRDGQLTAGNTASPLYRVVGPNQPIRLRVTYDGVTYPLYQGTQLEPVFDSSGVDSWVTVSAADGLARLEGIMLPASLFEAQIRALGPKAWFQLSEKTESDSQNRVSMTDAGPGAIPGYYIQHGNGVGGGLLVDDQTASATFIDLSEEETPFDYEQGPTPGGTDFGASYQTTYVGSFLNIFEDVWNYAITGSMLKPAGLGAGPGNMADPSRHPSAGTVTHSGVPASQCGGSFTLLMSIQFQRGKPTDPCGLFSQYDQTIADYQFRQMVHGAYVDGSTAHAGSNLGVEDFGNHPGRVVWNDEQTAWVFWSGRRVDDGRAHRIAFVWDAVACSRSIYIDGTLDSAWTGSGAHVGTYVSASLAIGLWRYSAPLAGSNIGCSAAMANVVTYDKALTAAQLLADYQTAHAPGAGDGTGQRAARIFAAIGIPSTAYALDAGDTVCEPTLLYSVGNSALDYLRLLEQAEGGVFYANKSNVLTFGRRSRVSQPPKSSAVAVFGDRPDDGELPYVEATPIADQQRIRNYLEITRVGGVTQVVQDLASVAAYGEQDYQEDGLPVADDDQAVFRGQYLRFLYSQPQNLIRTLTIDPADNDGLWRAMLAFGLDDRVTVRRRDNAGTVLFAEDALIIKVELTISRSGGWEYVLSLDPSSVASWLVLDDPVAGVLDSTYRLAW